MAIAKTIKGRGVAPQPSEAPLAFQTRMPAQRPKNRFGQRLKTAVKWTLAIAVALLAITSFVLQDDSSRRLEYLPSGILMGFVRRSNRWTMDIASRAEARQYKAVGKGLPLSAA